MSWLYIVVSLICLFFYIKSGLFRHTINFIIMWTLKIVHWLLKGLDWVLVGLIRGFGDREFCRKKKLTKAEINEEQDDDIDEEKVDLCPAKPKFPKSNKDSETTRLLEQILENPDITVSIKEH